MTLLIINTNHSFGIANAVNFWFENFSIFSFEINHNLLDILVTLYFYKLFLHWSKNVRDVFILFLIYKVIPFFEMNSEKNRLILEKLIYLINKRICIVEKVGDLYRHKVIKWENKTKIEKRKYSYYKMQKDIVKKFNNRDFISDMEIKDKLGIRFLPDMMKLKNIRKYSLNQDLERSTSNILSLLGNASKKIRFRNYTDLVDFEKVQNSILKTKQLVYCFKVYQDFNKILNEFKRDKEKIEKNPDLCPILIFQRPIDQYEFLDENEEEW